MPIVTVQLARRAEPVSRQQKQQLAHGITELMAQVLDKRRESVVVLLQQLDADDWAEGGELVSDIRQRRAAAAPADPPPARAGAPATATASTPHPAPTAEPTAEPSAQQLLRHLRRAQQVADRAAAAGHHPFGAVLVAADHETVLLEQGNVDTVNHAEALLAREAAARFTPEQLWGCTLYTTVEPCCMCAGTAYWANIGRVVFGMTEHALLQITGGHEQNPTLNLPCRDVFAAGQKPVQVIGPVPEVHDELAARHRAFWAGR